MMKYAVVGGGNTAFGLAATLKIRGFEVALLEAPELAASIAPVRAAGGIKLRGVAGEGLARVDEVTTDPARALDGAAVVFMAVPAYGHARMAELILPELKGDQVLALTPGNAGRWNSRGFEGFRPPGARFCRGVLSLWSVRRMGRFRLGCPHRLAVAACPPPGRRRP